MTIEKSIYVAILILLIISFSCASCRPFDQTPNVAGDIVSYKLVLQWLNSFCSNLTPPQRCRSSVPQDFTIHGFWGFDKDDKIVNCGKGYELSRYDDIWVASGFGKLYSCGLGLAYGFWSGSL